MIKSRPPKTGVDHTNTLFPIVVMGIAAFVFVVLILVGVLDIPNYDKSHSREQHTTDTTGIAFQREQLAAHEADVLMLRADIDSLVASRQTFTRAEVHKLVQIERDLGQISADNVTVRQNIDKLLNHQNQ